ncbi:MAG: hypothetical protein JO190_03400 [Candidatus Eremiobacteraeota bacterium]|nr:hypothetical protein [Candidatus Eremiobacteraeota bacterium]MBV8498437.1 hypothetical protein [Candidatus Eremiobacteraeota bacterium]
MSASLRVRAVREDRGRFAALHDSRVLIYWPHGLGDWVHFGAVLPLLEPSNAYAITRFGDDYVSLMEGNPRVRALLSGTRAPGDGSECGARHLGLNRKHCDGRLVTLELPAPLDERVRQFDPGVVLWTDYPETEGRTPYPFHTKARNLARLLVRPERLATFDLSGPLRNALEFGAPAATRRLVDERLAELAPPGTLLCVISRTGVTASRKNWGDGSEAREFVAAMRAGSPRWRFISMDEERLGEGVSGFRELFAGVAEPFARLYEALAARAHLFVGIPAGPLHVTMARGGVPSVGIWLAHHPDWYDEPNPDAIHIVGSYVRERGFDRRPATTTKPPSLAHRLRYVDSRTIDARVVVETARELTG